MTRSADRENRILQTRESYLSGKSRASVQSAANPALLATMGSRDAVRGTQQLGVGQGTVQANLIGGVIPAGAVLPSATRGKAGTFGDSRP